MRVVAAVPFAALLALTAACPKEGEAPATPAAPTAPTEQAPASQPAGAASQPTTTGMKVDRETVDPDGVVRRGLPLSPDLENLTVAAAFEKAKELEGKSVKITGTVESVCQPMGCWFVMQGDKPEQKIRISSKGHDIFVPRSAAGQTATVEGDLTLKVLSKDHAQHFEDERELKAGEQKKVFTEDQQELSIAVKALEMTAKKG
jgi:hypothetical protein